MGSSQKNRACESLNLACLRKHSARHPVGGPGPGDSEIDSECDREMLRV